MVAGAAPAGTPPLALLCGHVKSPCCWAPGRFQSCKHPCFSRQWFLTTGCILKEVVRETDLGSLTILPAGTEERPSQASATAAVSPA